MSLKHAAQHLKAQGRGPDNNLIHMSDSEIAGLQTLAKAHGTSLTINPKTGLPEAGALDKLMPLIVGAGLAYATGGASLGAEMGLAGLSNSAIIGGGMGLASLATGHDAREALMTGLGGYGGAGLGANLAATGAGPIPAYNANTGQVAPALTGPTPLHPNMVGPDTSPIVSSSIGADTEQLVSSLPKGNLLDNPTAVAPPGVGEFLADNKAYLAAGAAPALAGLMAKTKSDAPTTQTGMIRPYQMSYNRQVPANMVGSTYAPGQDTSERMWFQPEWKALPPYKAAQGGAINMAAGGISTLGGYSDGGRLLKGPGDGMSDNIPAQIGDKQPARLADGEFVVPADVVSHLGNGSTDAGAKQLYKMMDRIRSQRTGKKKQAPEVNPAKAMPA